MTIDGKDVPAANQFSNLPPEQVDRISNNATNHAYVHGEFSGEAAARGNTALAYNEAAESGSGARTAGQASDALTRQSMLNPTDTRLQGMAATATSRATEAQGYASRALSGAQALGPNPNIPGIPSAPSINGYPGGPGSPFGSGRQTL